jgi:hypothetical protein
MTEWISVKERLPISDQKVIAWGGKVYLAFFPGNLDDETFQEHWTICENSDCSCTGCTGAITHWMGLPDPPQ